MTFPVFVTVGLATCTGALAGWLMLEAVRGRRPTLAVLLQWLGTALMTLSCFYEVRNRRPPLDLLVGLTLLTAGLLLTAREQARRESTLAK